MLRSLKVFAAAAVVATSAATGVAGAAAAPSATTSTVTGTYTLHYEWYSAPGYWQTSNLILRADHTCNMTPPCTWSVSNTGFTMKFPNPRRGGIIYSGTVTPTGLNTQTSYGHMHFGNPYFGNSNEGDWYATKG